MRKLPFILALLKIYIFCDPPLTDEQIKEFALKRQQTTVPEGYFQYVISFDEFGELKDVSIKECVKTLFIIITTTRPVTEETKLEELKQILFGLEFYAFKSKMHRIFRDMKRIWTNKESNQNRVTVLNLLNAIKNTYIIPTSDTASCMELIGSYNLIPRKNGTYIAEQASNGKYKLFRTTVDNLRLYVDQTPNLSFNLMAVQRYNADYLEKCRALRAAVQIIRG